MSTILNPELLKIAHVHTHKQAFVDPATASAGGAPDPMAGAMPPMPAMGDPAAAGGAPPDPMAADPMAADPAAGAVPPEGGGGGVTAQEVEMIVQQAVAGLGGAGGGAGGEKMKVDVNTEIYHIKSLLTRIADEMGIKIEPGMLMGDPAMDPAIPQAQAAQDPNSAAANQPGSAIGPISGIDGASPALAAAGGSGEKMAGQVENGQAFDDTMLQLNNDKASALIRQLSAAAV